MVDYRQVWMKDRGKEIPKGWHIHHVLPRYMGGQDVASNLVCVSPELHALIHLIRYKRLGNYQELGAYNHLTYFNDYDPITIPVVCFDLDGNKVGRFNSVVEGSFMLQKLKPKKKVNSHQGNIVLCCQGKKKSDMGYQWFYESEVGDIDYIGPVKKQKNSGGKNTGSLPSIDLDKMIVYRSKSSASKQFLPRTRSIIQSDEFLSRFKPITKEEYYYLQELKQL